VETAMQMAMNNACHQRPAPSRASRFCASLQVLFLSVFLATNTVAGDSTASKADVERGVRTPKIDFIGNRALSSEKLMEVLLSRKGSWLTTRKGSWLTESGSLNPDALYEVTDDLTAFYYSNGFLDVQVDRPQIISIDRAMIGIDEGPLYRLGSIAIGGRLRFSRRDVESQLTIKSGQPFLGQTLQNDVLALADFYSDRGFAFVNVDPRTRMDSRRHLIDVKFFIKPGDEIRIDRITISGNTTTPVEVIRAALLVHEHELYSARALRESNARLNKLGLGTQITTQPSTKPDKINLKVTIAEKSRV
jgi:outer membrane protein insertion porin family